MLRGERAGKVGPGRQTVSSGQCIYYCIVNMQNNQNRQKPGIALLDIIHRASWQGSIAAGTPMRHKL